MNKKGFINEMKKLLLMKVNGEKESEERKMCLELKGVEQKYDGKSVIQDLNLTFRYGIYGFLGPNGAGKSTMLRMISTVERPASGEIYYQGEDIFSMGEKYREKLGYVPQKTGYYPDFTLYRFLQYIAALKGVEEEERVIKGALEQVHLWEEKDKRVKKLSGGMKERLSIAGALLNDPEILLLDEPTVGLDPNERMRFKNLLMNLSERKIIIFATHIVSDVEDIADQVVILHKGSVKLSESMEKVMERAENNVWECDLHDIEKIQKIMNTYPVSRMKRYKGGVHFRIISGEKPCEEAVRVAGSLEEIYMRITGRA